MVIYHSVKFFWKAHRNKKNLYLLISQDVIRWLIQVILVLIFYQTKLNTMYPGHKIFENEFYLIRIILKFAKKKNINLRIWVIKNVFKMLFQ